MVGESRVLNERDLMVLIILSGIFGAGIVFANIAAAVKLVYFLGLIVPAGTVAYSITFPITDIVDEVYGKRRAVYIVWAGLAAEFVILFMVLTDYLTPPLEPSQQVLFERVFIPQYRIVTASIAAYLVSQHHDVWAFWKWREITRGRHLWIRNNASTMVSQLIDSTIFITIAFYGVVTLPQLIDMIISIWLFKVLVAALDTPFVYMGVFLVEKYTVRPGIKTTTLPVKVGLEELIGGGR
jgi:uncharacterized integral membrane protein (TIGR00697 family)